MCELTTDKSTDFMEYLFISITTISICGNIEPIQISALGLNADFENIKSFSKGIRPSNVDRVQDNTLRCLGMCLQTLIQSRPKEDVFENFNTTFDNYKYIVVWDFNTYNVFKGTMKTLGITLCDHEVISMKEILKEISLDKSMYSDFESALMHNNIEYNTNDINYSKKRVKYLKELYIASNMRYSMMIDSEPMVVNQYSKIIHHRTCRYANDKECITVDKKTVFKGYIPCKICTEKQDYERLSLDYYKDLKSIATKNGEIKDLLHVESLENLSYAPLNIQLVCDKFGIDVVCADGDMAEVRTAVGSWRICVENSKIVKLLHRRLVLSKSSDDFEYHRQRTKVKSLYNTIRYIHNHDKNFLNTKKSRMDKLFDKVENERRHKKSG